jgi:hypothetical protein
MRIYLNREEILFLLKECPRELISLKNKILDNVMLYDLTPNGRFIIKAEDYTTRTIIVTNDHEFPIAMKERLTIKPVNINREGLISWIDSDYWDIEAFMEHDQRLMSSLPANGDNFILWKNKLLTLKEYGEINWEGELTPIERLNEKIKDLPSHSKKEMGP